MPRIVLIHPYRPSMAPIEAAFASLWPEAEVQNLLDEALYADVTPEGVMHPSLPDRIRTLVQHAVASRAEAVVFTGSTFGPAVDAARQGIAIPVLKSDEAMAIRAVERGGRALLVCTAARAIPVIVSNIETAAAEAGREIEIETLVVSEAKAALVAGDKSLHDRVVRDAILVAAAPDTVLLGQMSMADIRDTLPPDLAARTLTGPEATVEYLRSLLPTA